MLNTVVCRQYSLHYIAQSLCSTRYCNVTGSQNILYSHNCVHCIVSSLLMCGILHRRYALHYTVSQCALHYSLESQYFTLSCTVTILYTTRISSVNLAASSIRIVVHRVLITPVLNTPYQLVISTQSNRSVFYFIT